MSQNEDLPGLIKLLSHRIIFYVHLFAYVAVSLLLILIWAVTLPQAEEFYFIPFFPYLLDIYRILKYKLTQQKKEILKNKRRMLFT